MLMNHLGTPQQTELALAAPELAHASARYIGNLAVQVLEGSAS
jgi:hypothetical protein